MPINPFALNYSEKIITVIVGKKQRKSADLEQNFSVCQHLIRKKGQYHTSMGDTHRNKLGGGVAVSSIDSSQQQQEGKNTVELRLFL